MRRTLVESVCRLMVHGPPRPPTPRHSPGSLGSFLPFPLSLSRSLYQRGGGGLAGWSAARGGGAQAGGRGNVSDRCVCWQCSPPMEGQPAVHSEVGEVPAPLGLQEVPELPPAAVREVGRLGADRVPRPLVEGRTLLPGQEEPPPTMDGAKRGKDEGSGVLSARRRRKDVEAAQLRDARVRLRWHEKRGLRAHEFAVFMGSAHIQVALRICQAIANSTHRDLLGTSFAGLGLVSMIC